MPAVTNGNNEEVAAHLCRIVKALVAARIETIGIGIKPQDVRGLSPRRLVLERLHELPER